MKKFIPCGVAVIVLLSAISCREIENATDISEEPTYKTALTSKVKKDSLDTKKESDPSEEKANDPPPTKDGIKW